LQLLYFQTLNAACENRSDWLTGLDNVDNRKILWIGSIQLFLFQEIGRFLLMYQAYVRRIPLYEASQHDSLRKLRRIELRNKR